MTTRRLPLEQIQAEAYYIGTSKSYLPENGDPAAAGYSTHFEGAFVSAVPDVSVLSQSPEEFAIPPSDQNWGRKKFSREEYVRAVRECRTCPRVRAAVGVMSVALARYEELRPAVEQLCDLLDMDPSGVSLLGQGRDACVYAMDVSGQEFAVHAFHPDGPNTMAGYFVDFTKRYGGSENYQSALAAEKAASLASGHGIQGLVQLEAFSPPDGYCISPVVPGKEVADLTVEDIGRVKPKHITGLIATLKNKY